MISQKRIESRDRRRAAVHEAGHLVMMRHLGVLGGSAKILRKPSSATSERLWVGQTSFLPHILELSKHMKDDPPKEMMLKDVSPRELMLIGIAGVVAESAWAETDRDLLPYLFEDPNEMSLTDWAMTGCEPGSPSEQMINFALEVYRLFERPLGLLFSDLRIQSRGLIEAVQS